MQEYIFQSERMFFKHEISHALPVDTYSEHSHNGYELIYFLDGDATHVIEDRKYKLKKGDLILIRPMHYHFIQIDKVSDYERYNILFDVHLHGVESFGRLPSDVEVINLEGNPIAQDIFRKCDVYRKKCDDATFEKILSHLLSELFYCIPLFPSASVEEHEAFSPILSKALRFINENLCTLGGIDEIASHLFVSESYLFRLFRDELHRSPKRYIMDKRLLLAERLLAEGEKPTVVAEKCGFLDYTVFYRNYKGFFGRAPSGCGSRK
jgi:AraC-like DNA-binding protein